MNQRNKNLILVISTGIVGAALLLLSFFTISSILGSKKLSAINLDLDTFLRYSTLAVVIATICAAGCTFAKKLYTVYVSTALFAVLAIFSLALFISSFTQRSSIVDGYGYVFTEDEYLRFGLTIQQTYDCCGWENATFIVDEMECTGPLVCKTVVGDVISTCSIILIVFSFLALAVFSVTLYGSYKLIKEIKYPVALFDELTLQSLK